MAVLSRTMSSSPSQRLITTVATPLPTRLVNARHSLMNLSMPSRIASRLDRDIGDNCKGRRKRDENRAGDARSAFRRDHRDGQNPELLAQSKRRVRRLREKQRRKRHIDVGAVEIKAVAGREDEPNDGFGGAEGRHSL